jgi:hypothetical protein
MYVKGIANKREIVIPRDLFSNLNHNLKTIILDIIVSKLAYINNR